MATKAIETTYIISPPKFATVDLILEGAAPLVVERFSNNTQFFFEHNQAGTNLDVEIQIFTINGTIVKTINTTVSSDGFRSEPITWDGLDDYEDKIGRGIYVYKLKVKTAEGKAAEKIEKLVIIN